MSIFSFEPRNRQGQDKLRVEWLDCPVLGCPQVFQNQSAVDNRAVRYALVTHVAEHQLYDRMCHHLNCSTRPQAFLDQADQNRHDREHQLADSAANRARAPSHPIDPDMYKCALCNYYGIKQFEVTSHFRRVHLLGQFMCKACSRQSNKQSALEHQHTRP